MLRSPVGSVYARLIHVGNCILFHDNKGKSVDAYGMRGSEGGGGNNTSHPIMYSMQ